MVRAEPTRLALSCTLAQPGTLLSPLVGSYPTVSTLTPLHLLLMKEAGKDVAGIFSVAVVVETALPLFRPHLRFRGATLPL